MKRVFFLGLLLVALALATAVSFAACGDDDDDDDSLDGDDDNLPACDPYAEPTFWIDGDLDGNYGDYVDLIEDDGVLTGTLTLDGDAFTIAEGDFELSGTWNRDGDTPPMTDGQTVKLYYGEEAGDDGCCDTQTIVVWDEEFDLLFARLWNTELNLHLTPGDLSIDGETERDQVCAYQEGERPREGEADWNYVNGLALSGSYQDSEFAVDGSGGEATTNDGLYAVHLAGGYEGEVHREDSDWWTLSMTIEIVSLTDPSVD